MTNEIQFDADDYVSFLRTLKQRIEGAQIRAALSVNRELVMLYWQIGRDILLRQQQGGWGAKIIDQLSRDLRAAFPELKGFSRRNLSYMRAFAEAWPDEVIVQEPLAQLTWYHNITLLEKVANAEERLWYARRAINAGWSRNVLVHQVEGGLYERQGRALTNFATTLSPAQSDLARQMLKDPYNFDFLSLGQDAQERDLEHGLLAHLQAFLLEMGVGFAFVGSQFHLEVGNQDFYLDLLFYHLRLRCYVVVDLKIGDFQPEYVGKMNFYLAALDGAHRHPDDQPSIGLILCKSKNQVIVEYALRDMRTPIGVAEYRLTQALPEEWKGSLPTIEELERTLGDEEE